MVESFLRPVKRWINGIDNGFYAVLCDELQHGLEFLLRSHGCTQYGEISPKDLCGHQVANCSICAAKEHDTSARPGRFYEAAKTFTGGAVDYYIEASVGIVLCVAVPGSFPVIVSTFCPELQLPYRAFRVSRT